VGSSDHLLHNEILVLKAGGGETIALAMMTIIVIFMMQLIMIIMMQLKDH
jgi:hypothetical protein